MWFFVQQCGICKSPIEHLVLFKPAYRQRKEGLRRKRDAVFRAAQALNWQIEVQTTCYDDFVALRSQSANSRSHTIYRRAEYACGYLLRCNKI